MTPLSLQQYLAREETLRGLDPQLARVISGISEACKTISSLVRQGALAGVLGLAGSENVQGEEQKKGSTSSATTSSLKRLFRRAPSAAW